MVVVFVAWCPPPTPNPLTFPFVLILWQHDSVVVVVCCSFFLLSGKKNYISECIVSPSEPAFAPLKCCPCNVCCLVSLSETLLVSVSETLLVSISETLSVASENVLVQTPGTARLNIRCNPIFTWLHRTESYDFNGTPVKPDMNQVSHIDVNGFRGVSLHTALCTPYMLPLADVTGTFLKTFCFLQLVHS